MDLQRSEPLLGQHGRAVSATWMGAHLETVFGRLSDAVVVMDPERRSVMVNAAAERLFAHSAGELIGQDMQSFLKLDTVALGEPAHALTRSSRWSGVVELQRGDGAGIVLHVDVTALVGVAGPLEGFLAVLRQIAGAEPLPDPAYGLRAASRVARGSAVIETTQDGVIRLFAGDAEQMLGRRATAVVDRATVVSLLDPEELATRARDAGLEGGFDALVALVEQGTTMWSFVRPDGDSVLAEVSTVPVAQAGESSGSAFVLRDPSEAQRALQEVARAAERFLLVFDASPVASMITTVAEGRVVAANRATARMLGWEQGELLGRTVVDIGLWARLDEREALVERLHRDGHVYEHQDVIRTRSGKLAEVLTSLELIEFDGQPCLIGMFYDVSERVGAERKAALVGERVRLLLESTAEGIMGMDRDGVCTFINTAAASSLGYERAELVGRHIHDVVHHRHEDGSPYPWHECPTRRTLEEGLPVRMDTEVFWRRDGTALFVQLASNAIWLDGEIVGAVESFTDNTDRRRLLAELAEARDAALEASRLKSEFLARMSHEIRTPMNGVIGMASLLLETELDAEQREFARTVRTSAGALRAVIDDILDFSKIEAGRLELEETEFDLGDLVEEVCVLLAAAAHTKAIELVVALQPGLPVALRGDPVRVRQVLTNLVGNAVKFTHIGEVVVTASAVEAGQGRVTVRLEVRDSGVGIPFEAQAELFESFVQADVSTTRRYGGTGLGLTISERLVEMMGGKIGFESAPGAGSTFWCTLTFARGQSSVERRSSGLEGRRVLIVDDLHINREMLTARLEAWGMDAVAAGDGATALSLAHARADAGEPFDVVVTDLQMPGMDGMELADDLSRLAPAPPVVVLSSGGREGVRGRLADNVAAFMMKPPRLSQLRDALGGALGAGAVAPDVARTGRRRGDRRRGRILLVDDVPVNRQVAHAMLTRFGYEVEEARDGEEALAAVERGRFDAVLMDCEMPVLDGYAAAAEIRRRERGGRRTPIIALTASAMKGDAERARAAGMDFHVPKPIAIEQLQAVLDAVLEVPHDFEERALAPPGVAGPLDPERLSQLRRLYPDPRALGEFADAFIDDSRTRIDQLNAAVGDGDINAVWQAAHALTGSCTLAGAHRVAALLGDVEHQARDGEVPDEALLTALDDCYRAAEAALVRELG
jgi:PAS domain S-box-containing protein